MPVVGVFGGELDGSFVRGQALFVPLQVEQACGCAAPQTGDVGINLYGTSEEAKRLFTAAQGGERDCFVVPIVSVSGVDVNSALNADDQPIPQGFDHGIPHPVLGVMVR
jgi:hypothetical protein